jgi:cell volume regulation protein A
MTLTIENIMLIGSLLLLLSVVVGKTSYKFGVPTLLLFLTVGMLAGSDGLGGIYFNEPKIAQFIGIVALNFILFSGGLDTDWKSVKPILKPGIALSTFGVLFTALSLGVFVWWLTDFTIYESMLLGSIVSSTDAAAVFSILRSKSLGLKNNIRPTLELESGSNDPMAYVLTISFLTLVVHQDKGIEAIIFIFLQQMILGGALGFAFGKLSKIIINRIKLDFEGLYPVLAIALMFITFSATDFLGGNGFLAIYVCAVYLGNKDIIHKKTIMKMYDGLAWLMQIVLFLTLGLLVFPSQILPYIGIGLIISVFLILVARPIAVLLSLSFFKIDIRSKLYLSWAGLRGAVPIVFATYPLLAGIDKANMIFNLVFFIAVTSIMIQGTTLGLFAKWFKVALPDEEEKPLEAIDRLIQEIPMSSLQEILVNKDDFAVNKRIVDLHFPPSTFIVMIRRNGSYIRPGGSTEILADDLLMVLTENPEEMSLVKECLKSDSRQD